MKRRKYVPTLLLILLSCAASHAPRAEAKRLQARRETRNAAAAAAPKWEYSAITGVGVLNQGGKFTSAAQLCYFRGGQCKAGKVEGATNEDALAKAISAFGEDGWEMVGEGLSPAGTQDFKAIYFKRPKR